MTEEVKQARHRDDNEGLKVLRELPSKSARTSAVGVLPLPEMSREQFQDIAHKTMKELQHLSETKGREYTRGGADALDNFRRHGERYGVPSELVWAIYAGKHWDAIETYVRDVTEGTSRQRSEPIEGRINDMILYLLLFKGILEARRRA